MSAVEEAQGQSGLADLARAKNHFLPQIRADRGGEIAFHDTCLN
jgi:hypothetical protein